jgi:uncharacterized membrane protein YjgN (DUF898 family)
MALVTQTPPPGQPPYGSYPPNQYGAPPYGFAAPEHPQATLVLILGIVGLVACQLVSPFAWVIGNRVVREIEASNGQIGGRSMALAGKICGIIGTCIIGFTLLVCIAGLVFFLVAAENA